MNIKVTHIHILQLQLNVLPSSLAKGLQSLERSWSWFYFLSVWKDTIEKVSKSYKSWHWDNADGGDHLLSITPDDSVDDSGGGDDGGDSGDDGDGDGDSGGDLLIHIGHHARHQRFKTSPRENLSNHRLQTSSADELQF